MLVKQILVSDVNSLSGKMSNRYRSGRRLGFLLNMLGDFNQLIAARTRDHNSVIPHTDSLNGVMAFLVGSSVVNLAALHICINNLSAHNGSMVDLIGDAPIHFHGSDSPGWSNKQQDG